MLTKAKLSFLERMQQLREVADFLPPGTPPQVIRNEEGELHSETGPAYRSATRITWYRRGQMHGLDADYFGSVNYYWRGVLIPHRFYLERESLTLEEIFQHPNAEVRAVGVDIYGYDRMERDGQFKVVDVDAKRDRKLFRFESKGLHEPLMVVKVKNCSPEPDGTFRDYYLCVPPTVRTCQEAVAWTFNKPPEDYHPSLET